MLHLEAYVHYDHCNMWVCGVYDQTQTIVYSIDGTVMSSYEEILGKMFYLKLHEDRGQLDVLHFQYVDADQVLLLG